MTDQTAAHDLLHGYVPAGGTPEETAAAGAGDAAYRERVRASIAAHAEALLALRERGAVAFEYGNNLRAQAVEAGVAEAGEVPGFVAAYVRDILAAGVGPYRWIALSGDPRDLRRSEDALMEVIGIVLAGEVDRRSRASGSARRGCRRGSAGSASASATRSASA